MRPAGKKKIWTVQCPSRRWGRAGWMVEAAISLPVGENGIYLVADGLYGSISHENEGDKTNLLAGFGGVKLSFANEDRRRWRDTFPTLPE